MKQNRVVITGCGTINPLGKNVYETFENMCKGKCCIKTINNENNKKFLGAKVNDYNPEDYFSPKELILYDKFLQFSLIATEEAIKSSNISLSKIASDTCGIFFGACNGGEESRETAFKNLYIENEHKISPLTIFKIMQNSITSQISIKYNITGPSSIVSNACSSSNTAIIHAYEMIKEGIIKCAIVGGTDASLTTSMLHAWDSLGVLSYTGCRPFSVDRDGIVLGEGSAVFFMENLDDAILRGAHIYAEIVNYSLTADAESLSRPSEKGIIKALEKALMNVDLKKVDYINAHGTGTKLNDITEISAITKVFGPLSSNLFISSTKSMHGHLLGASGAIELLACILAIEKNIIPPTINITKQDPAINNVILNTSTVNHGVNIAISNSFAFGGINTIIVISKFC